MDRSAVVIGAAVLGLGVVGVANLDLSNGAGADPRAADRLAAVPLRIGPWAGVELPMPPNQLRVAEAEAHLSRSYEHDRTRARVSVLVLYGRPGPLGAHTPETCYGAAGFCQVGGAVKKALAIDGGPTGDLWTGRFDTEGFPPRTLSVTWGWGVGDWWKAADTPRLEFAALPRLYKLYATRPLPPGGGGTDVTAEFLTAFLPELRRCLTAPDVPTPTPAPPSGRGGTTQDVLPR